MGTIKSLYARVKTVKVEQVAVDSFAQVQDAFTEENKKQLFAGFNKLGDRLREYQSPVYAEAKNRFNPLPGFGNPDLFNTGSFYAGIETRISGSTILESSSDSKNDELVKKYPAIFGLGGDYKVEFVKENYRPAFMAEVRKITGL